MTPIFEGLGEKCADIVSTIDRLAGFPCTKVMAASAITALAIDLIRKNARYYPIPIQNLMGKVYLIPKTDGDDLLDRIYKGITNQGLGNPPNDLLHQLLSGQPHQLLRQLEVLTIHNSAGVIFSTDYKVTDRQLVFGYVFMRTESEPQSDQNQINSEIKKYLEETLDTNKKTVLEYTIPLLMLNRFVQKGECTELAQKYLDKLSYLSRIRSHNWYVGNPLLSNWITTWDLEDAILRLSNNLHRQRKPIKCADLKLKANG